MHDCGTDMMCFKGLAMSTCGPASVTITRLGVTVYAEVRPSRDYCEFTVRLVNITLAQSASDEDRRRLEELRPLFPLATMFCTLTREQSGRLDDASFITSQEVLDQCSGALKQNIENNSGVFRADVTPTPTASYPGAATATPTTTGGSGGPETPCVDSDGRNFFTPGTVSGGLDNYCPGSVCYDRCVEHTTFGTRVREYKCENNHVVTEEYECPVNPDNPSGYRCASINNGAFVAGACVFQSSGVASPTATAAPNVTSAPTAVTPSTATCFDSDVNITPDYNYYGYVTGGTGNYCAGGTCYDRCVEYSTFGTHVREYKCVNNAVTTEEFECPINPSNPSGYRCASINNGVFTAGACAFRSSNYSAPSAGTGFFTAGWNPWCFWCK